MQALAAAVDPDAAAVLGFWIGGPPYDADWLQRRQPTWFASDPALDAEISSRFGELVAGASAGRCDHWATRAPDWLALLLLLDQFRRNLFRGDARAFACDPKALAIARDGIGRGLDRELPVPLRLFCYLPFEHAEDAAAQAESVAHFRQLHAEAPAGMEAATALWLDYALRHARPVERFGRFPHRNAVLGRDSSDAERRWLEALPMGF